jgi:hypothetical protein
MSMFRSKKLDLGAFVNIKVIRDHTKRKVFAENETQRYVPIDRVDLFPIIRGTLLTYASPQTSSAVHHPQPDPPAQNARSSTTPIDPDALLHPLNANQKPMY